MCLFVGILFCLSVCLSVSVYVCVCLCLCLSLKRVSQVTWTQLYTLKRELLRLWVCDSWWENLLVNISRCFNAGSLVISFILRQLGEFVIWKILTLEPSLMTDYLVSNYIRNKSYRIFKVFLKYLIFISLAHMKW